ncbi:hypothetical protein Tco_1372019, partial [Tanacetum coccineum]
SFTTSDHHYYPNPKLKLKLLNHHHHKSSSLNSSNIPPHSKRSLSNSSLICRCQNTNGNGRTNADDDDVSGWDKGIREGVGVVVKWFDDCINGFKNINNYDDDDVDMDEFGDADVEKGEWDWERWKKHFVQVDEQEKIVSILQTENKLSPLACRDLVFIHNNLRLLSRSTDEYNEEKTMMWDVGGDDTGTLEDTGFLEFASLSLDEPELERSLAFKVLGQPTSSSCCERNWSTYSFIHSLRRNKLSPKRAEDLVFIHNNLRLLSRSTDQYNEEKTMMWDVGGDDFGTLEDTTFLEFVSLSLDKPELERVFFSEDTITT